MLKQAGIVTFTLFAIFFCISCDNGGGENGGVAALKILTDIPDSLEIYSGPSPRSQKVDFSGGLTTSITLENLTGQNVFLVKVNNSSSDVSVYNTGHVTGYDVQNNFRNVSGKMIMEKDTFQDMLPVSRSAAGGNRPIRRERTDLREIFTEPDFLDTSNRSLSGMSILGRRDFGIRSGSHTKFWVDDRGNGWEEVDATLAATGTYCKVWIADVNHSETSNSSTDNKLKSEQGVAMAAKFDTIYGYMSPIFGYEYGGGLNPGDPGYGGIDGEPKINIFVYDIGGDYSSWQNGGVFGYFWSKDHYLQTEIGLGAKPKSNETEMFYIDSHFADAFENDIYSTLVHEYQHMINYYQKFFKAYLAASANSKPIYTVETWYNEMLSMLAEDLISPKIDVLPTNPGHPVQNRIPLFLAGYSFTGITEWRNDYIYHCYSNVYSFGAYLVRNFGGAELLNAIAGGTKVNIDSIGASLNTLRPLDFSSAFSADNFKKALAGFGDALLFSGARKKAGDLTFDQDTPVFSAGGNNYAFSGFDVWEMKNDYAGIANVPGNYKGPLIWDLKWIFEMPAYSFIVQSLDTWQQVEGDMTITFEKPSDPNVEFHMVIR